MTRMTTSQEDLRCLTEDLRGHFTHVSKCLERINKRTRLYLERCEHQDPTLLGIFTETEDAHAKLSAAIGQIGDLSDELEKNGWSIPIRSVPNPRSDPR